MRVLVTGGAGFIGSHVVDALLALDHHVSVLDDLSSGRRENVDARAAFYQHALTQDLEPVFRREKPEAVVHLAAQISVPRSVKDPLADHLVNVTGTLNLLEACRAHTVGRVVFASSAAVFGEPAYLPLDEDHPPRPLSPYGLSKFTAEQYLGLYRRLYGISSVVLRFANVYGPRQSAGGEGGVVSIFLDHMVRQSPPGICGDGEQTRDFVYVLDVARASVAALFAGEGAFNIGTGETVTINRLWQMLKELTGFAGEPVYAPPRPGDIRHSFFQPARATKMLGWRPNYTLAQGLAGTVDYFRQLYGAD